MKSFKDNNRETIAKKNIHESQIKGKPVPQIRYSKVTNTSKSK